MLFIAPKIIAPFLVFLSMNSYFDRGKTHHQLRRHPMQKTLSWDEMKSIYPNEWLLITDFELDESGHLISGVVSRHSVDKDEVYRLPTLNKPSSFKYTGESTFSGGWRVHAEHNHF
jgi:hypothetical protein